MPRIEELIEELKRCLASRPEVRLGVLFGSVAQGTSRPGSDMDVGVLLAAGDSNRRRTLEVALARAARRPVDVVYLDHAPPLVRFEIAKDGELLVEQEPYLWADFKARAMLDWWDWAPLARRFHQAAARRLRQRTQHGPA